MEIFINPAKTCAVTGHRIVDGKFCTEKLKKCFYKLVEGGYDTFLVGMAIGFDTLCFQTLESVRREKNIKIIACIPCETQSAKFNNSQKEEYDRMLNSADGKIMISTEYTPRCMHKRNVFMVDNSSCLIAYINRDFGGTANTVKYAEKKGVMIIRV